MGGERKGGSWRKNGLGWGRGVALADCTDTLKQMLARQVRGGEVVVMGRLLPLQIHSERPTFLTSMSSTRSSTCQVRAARGGKAVLRGLALAWWNTDCPASPSQKPTSMHVWGTSSPVTSVPVTPSVPHLVQPGVTNRMLLSREQTSKQRPHQGAEVPHPELEGLQGLRRKASTAG